jgi:hypothetical protein
MKCVDNRAAISWVNQAQHKKIMLMMIQQWRGYC